MYKLILRGFCGMKNLMLVAALSVFLFGCQNDLKLIEEVEDEQIESLTGLWLEEECQVTSESEMHRGFIKVDEYGNVEQGKRHFTVNLDSEVPRYKCEGGFTETLDSTDYIDSVTALPWGFSDGSSNEFAKIVNLNSGLAIAIDARHEFPYGNIAGNKIIRFLDVSGDCIELDTCDVLDDREVSYSDVSSYEWVAY